MAAGDTEHPLTPRGKWAQGRAKEAELLAEALEATGVSKQQLGERWGMHRTRVNALCNPEMSNSSVPLRVLWLLPRKARAALLASVGQVMSGEPADHFGDNHMGRLLFLQQAASELIGEYIESLADKRLDDQEKQRIRKVALKLQRSITGLLESLEGQQG